ncbi:hypothetical protein AGABI1DRAFT_80615 [Agaricus bisporus var. burnettii JB137-S8]|uniref:chitin deacetylase n=1 Tax=Agaricus bisporus var. burnettii (strain JB137-S8 / ATCC MYA-4627 / FGSC 10392) TaxID=597362 RepID=K5VKK0_AGABU|nr:uncharacterized protein AGABI1DRAFT_80615 [Agaricus bisporus var. burnettii JB137-S8]EKM74894.1 hypothetical protein AGABI1DRAFT_80615 [Agaricus bisporus var. burnettii JB137-S8]
MHSTAFLLILAVGSWAQDRTTEAGEAAIKDPGVECSPYGYPPVTAQLSAFPPSAQRAKILPSDTTAQALWRDISSKVPTNIAVKPASGPPGYNYDGSDPDCWWTWSRCVSPKQPGLEPDVADVPEPSTLGYGFDDGPYCGHNLFYDFLASKDQKTTFFFIGTNVMDYPLEAQRAVVDGHEVCVHTWSHPPMTSLSNEDAFAELYYSMQIIKLVTGVTPTCWRPPYGDVDDRIRAIAQALGLQNILWKYDSDDWQFGSNGVTKEQIDANYEKMLNDGRNGLFDTKGAIILSHELNNFTLQEAIDIYPEIMSVFKHVVPVGVALNKTYPYVEKDFVLPSFEEYIHGMHTATPDDVDIPDVSNGTNGNSSPTTISTPNAAASSSAPSPPPQAPPPAAPDASDNGALTHFTFISPMIVATAIALWMLAC